MLEPEESFGEGPFVYRLNDAGTGPPLLTQVFLERGWREYNFENGDNWNLWWKTSGFPLGHHKNLFPWQILRGKINWIYGLLSLVYFHYINHIPKGSSICRKDNLVRYLRCMKKIYGSIYDFSPHGYNLPLEYTKLAAECNRSRPITAKDELEGYYEDKPIWICKPVAQSQGKGIFLFRKLSELNYNSNTIVQKYIEKPLLIGGYKFDLRLYVCIPSYHPLTIYIYKEGLTRFGTDKFTLNDLRNPFRHLTNSSINKLGPGYAEMKDRVGSGCKWTLKQLRKYFRQAGISDWLLWQRISCIVLLTLLSHLSLVPPTSNCFEFFGFDILIDSMLKPWLLEVNLSPALANDCDVDRIVKKPMLHDMLDLLGLPMYNTGLSIFNVWSEEFKENSRLSSNIQMNLPVIQAAGRWRKKHRRALARPKSTSRAKQKLFDNSDLCRDKTTVRSKRLPWGNGKDWRNAPAQEGGWIRVCPFNQESSCLKEEGSVKQIVAQVIRWIKIAKEISRSHPSASECQLNEFLLNQMEMTGELWMPPS